MIATTAPTSDARIARLRDESDIRELLARYATAVDRWDLARLATCYHPGATDEHGAFNGPAEDYVPWVESLGADRHAWGMHLLGTTFVDVDPDGDTAWAETYALSTSRMLPTFGIPDRNRVMPVRYCDRHARRDGEWRIAHRKVVYERGRIAAIEIDRPLTERHRRGAKDQTDLIYQAAPERPRSDPLGRLLDESAIRALLARTAHAIDTRDFELLAASFDTGAVIDHGPELWDGPGFAEYLRGLRMEDLDYCIHFLANQRLELAGETAWAETYCLVMTRTPSDAQTPARTSVLPVRYWDQLRSRDGVWRIVSRQAIYETGRVDTVRGETERSAETDRLDRDGAMNSGARTLEQLEAESSIRRVLADVARACDRGDAERLRRGYHIDGVDRRGGESRSPAELTEHLRKEWWERTEWSMHFLGNILLAVNGDRARCETYCLEVGHFPAAAGEAARDIIRPVRYLDSLERRDGQWRIAARLVCAEPGRLDPVGTFVELTPQHHTGRRDRTDPTYMSVHHQPGL